MTNDAHYDISQQVEDELNPFDTPLDDDAMQLAAVEPILPLTVPNEEEEFESASNKIPATITNSNTAATTTHQQHKYQQLQELSIAEPSPHPSSSPSATLQSPPTPHNNDIEPEILPVCWQRELRILMELAIPAVLVNLFSVAMGTVSQMLVGHISSDALAAAVCANLVFNVLWFFLFGFAGALDTLGAQSFGAGSMSGVNLWTKRAFILVSILSVPIMVPLFFSYGIMTTILAQPDDVAQVAQTYCRWLVFGLWPFAMTVVLQKYLQAQGIMKPTIWIAAVSNIINVALEAFLIWPAGMDVQGGALGMSLARWAQFIITAWYTFNHVKDAERAELDKVAAEVASHYDAQGNPLPNADNNETSLSSISESTAIDMSSSSPPPVASPSKLTALRTTSTRVLKSGARKLTRTASETATTIQRGARRSMRQLADGAKTAAGYVQRPQELIQDMATLRRTSMEGVWNGPAIKTFVLLGLSAGIMAGLEAWAFETTGIMATSLSTLELDAHYVLLNITLITYFTFPFGVSIAASIRIGNLVGAGHVETARLTAKIVGCIGAGFMALSGMFIASTHSFIGGLFSNDEGVIQQVSRIAPIGGMFQLFDGVQGSVGGVLRGLGMQRAAALSNLIGLWCCGVVSAYLITFPGGVGLPGLWWGLLIGLLVTSVVSCTILYRTNWNEKVAEAQERIRVDEAEQVARREKLNQQQANEQFQGIQQL